MRRLCVISACLVLGAASLQAAPRIEAGSLADSPFVRSKSMAMLGDRVYLVDADTAGKIAFGPGGNELWLLDPGKSRISVSRWGCAPAVRGELCLGEGGRFRAEVDWQTGSGRGVGERVVAPATDSGLFYFFDPHNWEMLVKVLDGCAINQHYWVLAAATTDVGFRLAVRDLTAGGAPRVYSHPEGRAAPAIVDSQALGGCPSGGR